MLGPIQTQLYAVRQQQQMQLQACVGRQTCVVQNTHNQAGIVQVRGALLTHF
jgi:hypothetical protein